MHPPIVFLNKGLASTVEVLRIVSEARRPSEFRLLATHPRADFPGQWSADAFEVEPDDLGNADYVEWCLDVARRHRVGLFVPGRKAAAIAAAHGRFEALGTRLLIAADARTLALLEDKAACYTAVGPEIVARPEHIVAESLPAFDSAVTTLRGRGHRVCFKPTTSVYGLGFRTLVNSGSNELSGDPSRITIDGARKYLDRTPFRRQLVMQHLPGKERSVDCLAQRGQLILAIVRRKGIAREFGLVAEPARVAELDTDVVSQVGSEPQWLEENPALQAAVREMTARLELDGMFNVQFRDDRRDVPHLLEINARMSGGLPMACQSGVAVPYWAIRLALGTAQPHEVPQPRTGFVVEPTASMTPLPPVVQ